MTATNRELLFQMLSQPWVARRAAFPPGLSREKRNEHPDETVPASDSFLAERLSVHSLSRRNIAGTLADPVR